MSEQNVKIIKVFVMFLRIVQKVNFGAREMEDMFRHQSPLPSNYIILSTDRQERLYDSYKIIIPWAKHLSRCCTPDKAA